MRITILILTLLFVPVLSGNSFSQEPIYPDGYAIECTYTLSDTVITFGDTLTIQRILTNNDSFTLSNLYFSDNLPTVFTVVDFTAQVGMEILDVYSSGAQTNEVVDNYNAYYWVLDSPNGSEGADVLVSPGQTVILTARITSSDIGNFLLPLHTTVFYGDGTGHFAASDSIQVRVAISAGIEDELESNLLPARLQTTAFPNPFNSTVTIAYNGRGINGSLMRLDIFNVLGQQVWNQYVGQADTDGLIRWETPSTIGSGVYFYQLSAGTVSSRGKLLLVK